jgi:predicted membrane protein (TIGR00267 family)
MKGSVKEVLPGFQGIAFGLMDGLITMLGIIMGISTATGDAKLVITAGIIGGIANGFANSIGLYASELAERGQQIQDKKRGKQTHIHTMKEIWIASGLAFVSSIVALILPIVPFMLFPIQQSMIVAFVISSLLLFFLGYEVGRISEEDGLGMGIKYVLAGLFGAVVCFMIGDLLQHWLKGEALII